MSGNEGPLINIPHHILSLLQPHVRLYKVIFDDDGNEMDSPNLITLRRYKYRNSMIEKNKRDERETTKNNAHFHILFQMGNMTVLISLSFSYMSIAYHISYNTYIQAYIGQKLSAGKKANPHSESLPKDKW